VKRRQVFEENTLIEEMLRNMDLPIEMVEQGPPLIEERKKKVNMIEVEAQRLVEANKWEPRLDFEIPNDLSGLTMPDKITREELFGEIQGNAIKIQDKGFKKKLPSRGRSSNNTMMRSEKSMQQVVESRVNKIFGGKISQRIGNSVFEFSECSFLTHAHLDRVSQFPMIADRHLLFERINGEPFFNQMNYLVNHRKTRFRRVLFGWLVDQNLKSYSFKNYLDCLKGTNFIGKQCSIPGFEFYLIPAVLFTERKMDLKVDDKLRANIAWIYQQPGLSYLPDQQIFFAMCLTDEFDKSIRRPPLRIEHSFVCQHNPNQYGGSNYLEHHQQTRDSVINIEESVETGNNSGQANLDLGF